MENENGQDDSVGQEGRGHLDEVSHRGGEQEATVQDERLAARPEESCQG